MDLQSDFYIDGWKVQPAVNRIIKGGVSTALEYRVMRVLLCLAENAPEPVTRDHLLEVAWPDLHTSEHSLTTVISELRKIFEDDPRRPQYIETIRKIGYRLMVVPIAMPIEQIEVRASPPPARKQPRYLWALLLPAVLLLLLFMYRGKAPQAVSAATMAFQPKPLTSYPGGEFDPSLSPLGGAIAFVWEGESQNFDIYLKNLTGESPRRLTQSKNFDGSPVWSPQAQNIAYMSSANGECGIFITSITGGDVRRVADCNLHDESALDWSADDRYIVFSDRQNYETPSKLFLIDLKTHLVSTLTEPSPDLVGDRDPCFSPDGSKIAFVRGTLSSTVAPEISPVFGDLHIMDLATRTITRVTHENVEMPGVTWTPDGKSLIFASNRDGLGYGLWQVALSGGGPQEILRGKDLIRNPTIDRQGEFLVYEDWERDTNIWRLPLKGTNLDEVRAEQFIMSTRWESHPEISPDGRRIAFASKRSGTTEIWVCNADGKQPQKITSFGGPYVNVPRWSPDSSALAFEVRQGNQSHIFRIQLTGNARPEPMTTGTGYQMAPSWSQDGESLYFGSNRNGSWQVWKIASTGGEPQLVTPHGGFQAFESGEHLYFTQLKRMGIWRKPLAGGEAEIIIDQTYPQDWDNWTVRPEGIYFIRRVNLRNAAFCKYPFPAGPVQDLLTFKSHRVLGKNGMSVSPDGTWALFTKLDQLTGDLMHADGLHFPKK